MKQYNLCFLGFGNVGRALTRLLVAKSAELRELYGIEFRVTGVASRRLGWLSKSTEAERPEGFDFANLVSNPLTLENSFNSKWKVGGFCIANSTSARRMPSWAYPSTSVLMPC